MCSFPVSRVGLLKKFLQRWLVVQTKRLTRRIVLKFFKLNLLKDAVYMKITLY